MFVGTVAAAAIASNTFVSPLNGQVRQEKKVGSWPWSPARLADGQPNIQGMYVPPDWGQPFERVPPREGAPAAPARATAQNAGDADDNSFSDVPRSKNPNPMIV